jgi:hypothetical protein
MQTQQQGTDISGDVSWLVDDETGVEPVYEFKASVTRTAGQAAGVFDVTVAAGDGIDGEHAEIGVYHGATVDSPAAVEGLNYWVDEMPAVAGQAVFRVSFSRPNIVLGAIAFVLTDPTFASVTVRRKVPSVN